MAAIVRIAQEMLIDRNVNTRLPLLSIVIHLFGSWSRYQLISEQSGDVAALENVEGRLHPAEINLAVAPHNNVVMMPPRLRSFSSFLCHTHTHMKRDCEKPSCKKQFPLPEELGKHVW